MNNLHCLERKYDYDALFGPPKGLEIGELIREGI